ncbi:pantoate--beta-alanine ligase [Aliagarivorans taiwanensis]|uniref:pantoate--beta-alanine ligase n=1 Tax=Aliagarivorans taiwanensis TaxID=561966 RepID=UPI00041FC41E|nr:pantoate--beta-alanine ligase [Aliagarivorans taiwanensis]
MKVITSIEQLRPAIAELKQAGSLGFVPSMGNLHDGHLALVSKAGELADQVAVSIFVNPMQFNNASDLDSYPRTLEQDLAALEQAGVALVFTPTPEVMYPNGLERETRIEVTGLHDVLEGAMRPGHFTGVATVVTKLFNLMQPDVAVFGEKDYQQLALIRKFTRDLMLPIEIVGLPTVREASGLAMSSRNNRLSQQQRDLAPKLAQIMRQLAERVQLAEIEQTIAWGEQQLNQQGFRCDGIDIVDADTLAPLNPSSQRAVILMAAFLGDVRLIDNLVVALPQHNSQA